MRTLLNYAIPSLVIERITRGVLEERKDGSVDTKVAYTRPGNDSHFFIRRPKAKCWSKLGSKVDNGEQVGSQYCFDTRKFGNSATKLALKGKR